MPLGTHRKRWIRTIDRCPCPPPLVVRPPLHPQAPPVLLHDQTLPLLRALPWALEKTTVPIVSTLPSSISRGWSTITPSACTQTNYATLFVSLRTVKSSYLAEATHKPLHSTSLVSHSTGSPIRRTLGSFLSDFASHVRLTSAPSVRAYSVCSW